MKRKCTFFILILCSFSLLANSFVSTVSDNGLSYLLSINEQSFKSPATFSYSDGQWFIGELRASGLLRFMISPSKTLFDYGNSKSFQKVSTPALNPAFIGVERSFSWGDIAAFLPYGFYANAGTKKVFCGLLGQYSGLSFDIPFMTDWQDLNKGFNVSNIYGFSDGFSRGKFNLKAFSFVQFVYKDSFGLSGNLGWNINSSIDWLRLELYRRTGSVNSYGYTVGLSSLNISYNVDVYGKAVYGGTAQKKSVELLYQIKFGDFSFSVSNRAEADPDSGKIALTEYGLSYSGESLSCSFDFGINRIKNSPMSVNKLGFNLSGSNATFGINGAKFSMSFSVSDSIDFLGSIVKINLSFNQDRKCSINAGLSL